MPASPPWQDQRVNSINREEMSAHFLPFMTEKAAEQNRALPASERYGNSDGQRRVSLDGTLEAAAWESGMDNAIRFDDAVMINNGSEDAWSIDQESVDLNAYLANECRYLKKFADILGESFDGPDYTDRVADYFYDSDRNYFFDRLEGLKEDGPIHENYDTHTGKRLKAPHFSWSASHLIMLYQEYGRR